MDTADTIKHALKSLRPIVRERFASHDPIERQWAIDFIGEWLEERLNMVVVPEASLRQLHLLELLQGAPA